MSPFGIWLRERGVRLRHGAQPGTDLGPVHQPQLADDATGESWWPQWRDWLLERSGQAIPAPKEQGSKNYPRWRRRLAATLSDNRSWHDRSRYDHNRAGGVVRNLGGHGGHGIYQGHRVSSIA